MNIQINVYIFAFSFLFVLGMWFFLRIHFVRIRCPVLATLMACPWPWWRAGHEILLVFKTMYLLYYLICLAHLDTWIPGRRGRNFGRRLRFAHPLSVLPSCCCETCCEIHRLLHRAWICVQIATTSSVRLRTRNARRPTSSTTGLGPGAFRTCDLIDGILLCCSSPAAALGIPSSLKSVGSMQGHLAHLRKCGEQSWQLIGHTHAPGNKSAE